MMNLFDFEKMKKEGRKISMVTCYDFWSARIFDRTEIDCLLVGDSVAMVMHGHPTTLQATSEMLTVHTAAVARGTREKFIVADMPFLSFRKGPDFALEVAGSLMQAGAHSVKLEGVWGHEETVKRLVGSGIPVMGHIGLTPQSIHHLGGFKVQGRTEDAALDLKRQALALEKLGCFALVLECIPAAVAQDISASLRIPAIGIGAGPDVDGQVLVLQDLLGLNGDFKPKFLRRFLEGDEQIRSALKRFHQEVQEKTFPTQSESYS